MSNVVGGNRVTPPELVALGPIRVGRGSKGQGARMGGLTFLWVLELPPGLNSSVTLRKPLSFSWVQFPHL